MSLHSLTVVINFHRERLNAHPTLRCVNAAALQAHEMNIPIKLIYILDDCDAETVDIIERYNAAADIRATIVSICERDLGAARNHGARIADSHILAFCDGDDLYSRNWFSAGYHMLIESSTPSVAHPEYVVNFGVQRSYARQTDLSDRPRYGGLFVDNWWCSWTMAWRDIYINIPYSRNELATTGFGFEDWHWNCEVISRGISHVLVPQTVGYYRRSNTGLLAQSLRNSRLLRPTSLFKK